MNLVQGSLVDEYGCPVDPEWERFQRMLRDVGVGAIRMLRPNWQEEPRGITHDSQNGLGTGSRDPSQPDDAAKDGHLPAGPANGPFIRPGFDDEVLQNQGE